MSNAPQWDGNLYRPVKPNEDLQPGTLDWKEMKDQRLARIERGIAPGRAGDPEAAEA